LKDLDLINNRLILLSKGMLHDDKTAEVMTEMKSGHEAIKKLDPRTCSLAEHQLVM
jgi:hypothetical protein